MEQIMRMFVTGSTGLLGNNLVRRLLEDGHEVLALARSKDKAARELGDTQARIVIGDMTDVPAFAEALSGVDVVFHTAAFFRDYFRPGDHSQIVDRINVDGTMNLARAAHARGVAKMIDTSSSGIIGLEPDGSPGDEQTPAWPGVERNLYLRSKQKVEPLLRAFSQETGFFVASALPGWMWGPRDAGPTTSGQLAFDALAHKLPPMIPPGGSSTADARDVATGMLRIAEVGRSGERYILSGRYVDLGQILTQLAALTATKPPKVRIPFAGMLSIAAVAETWSRITGKSSPITLEGIRLMNARLAVTAAKAEAQLGVTFRPFEQTLADTVAWTRARLQETGHGGSSATQAGIAPWQPPIRSEAR
jgi:dihydroflavonol-4-reductase